MALSNRYLRLILLIACCAAAPALPAQSETPVAIGVTQETVENRIREVEAASELDATVRDNLLELYRRTLGLIEQRRGFEANTAEYVAARETAPAEAQRLRSELQQLESRDPPRLPADLTRQPLSELEQRLLTRKTELTALEARRSEIEAVLETQSRRAEPARERLAAAREQQAAAVDAQKMSPPPGESQRVTEARRWALEAGARALAAEIEMLNQELLSQPMRLERLQAQLDLVNLQAARERQYTEAFEALVIERRQSEAATAQEAAEETERQAFGKHPLLQEIAQGNTELGEELNRRAAELESVSQEENLVAGQAKRFDNAYRLARQKLEIAGLSQALGQVLLEQRRGLPDAKDFESSQKRRQQRVIESSLQQIQYQQERAQLRDINVYVDTLLETLPESERTRLRQDALELAKQRRELLDKAIAAEDSFLQALGELEFAQRELAQAVIAYSNFLDERLLWIRSGAPPSWQTLQSVGETLGVLVSTEHWSDLLTVLFRPTSIPWLLILGFALFALLVSRRGALRAALERSGRKVGQLRHDRLSSTLRATLLTLMLSLSWPVLFTALGWHLQLAREAALTDLGVQWYRSTVSGGDFVLAIGAAFRGIALYSLYFIAFRWFCAPVGLAAVHFGWNRSVCAQLNRLTRRLMWVFLPSAFILITAVTFDPAALAGGLSRLAFVIVMGALAWFFGRILWPRSGTMHEFYDRNPGSPWTWGRYLWFALGLVLPIGLAALAFSGYVYTAAQFSTRLVDTLWLIVALILIHQLVVRWILLMEHRLAFKAALERHRAARAAREAQEEEDENPPPVPDGEAVDYSALSVDTKKLINTALVAIGAIGLWAIWADVSPAFRILDDISLWSYTSTVAGADKVIPVTLGDVILGALIIGVGLIAARRLPALMEILILSRLNITAGSRYAISTLTQYSIVAIGIVLVFNLLGGSWSEIQWLIAALGVGIGFGLQEIVANFICGLILLFERPIRIGDIVTVGDTSGVVTRIRIRSTTIRNWDQQELIVPNKEFITGRLLNWTLSDPIARIVIPVGIAYGSDVAEAIRLIREAATTHERVLDEPEPLVTFDSFGDSSLLIMLRCYIGSLDYRLLTISEINQEIERRLGEAGITVAFPQLDVHLDTAGPLEVRLQDAPAGA